MQRKRNFLPLAGFLVCAGSVVSYLLLFSQFVVTRDVPWVSWLLFALGLGLVGAGLVRAFRQPERYRGKIAGPVFGALSLAVVAMFFMMTMVMSRQLPASANAPQIGEKAPEFSLADARGQQVRLSELLARPAGGGAPGSWVLLIFYRGYW